MAPERDDIRNELGKVADRVWAGVPKLVAAFRPELKRVGRARRETNSVLSAGRDRTASVSVRNSYGSAGNEQVQLCDATLKLVQDALEPLAAMVAGTTSQPTFSGLVKPELRVAVAQLRAVDLSSDAVRLFLGMTLVQLLASLEDYLDICEAYLGRDIGSHKTLKRIAPVMKTLLWGVPGLLLGPIGDLAEVIYEAGKQTVTSPLDEDLKRVRQAAVEGARLHTLRTELRRRLDAMPFVEETVASAVDGIVEQGGEARKYLEVIRPLVEVPSR